MNRVAKTSSPGEGLVLRQAYDSRDVPQNPTPARVLRDAKAASEVRPRADFCRCAGALRTQHVPSLPSETTSTRGAGDTISAAAGHFVDSCGQATGAAYPLHRMPFLDVGLRRSPRGVRPWRCALTSSG